MRLIYSYDCVYALVKLSFKNVNYTTCKLILNYESVLLVSVEMGK